MLKLQLENHFQTYIRPKTLNIHPWNYKTEGVTNQQY